MESIGTRLRNRRESRKLSFGDVYKKTNIHADVIAALEEDRFDILSPVYIKGFLKTYSSFLKLDVNEILDEYNAQAVAERPVAVKPKQTASDRLRPKLSSRQIFIIGIIFVIFMVLSFILRAKPKGKIEPVKPADTQTPTRLEAKPVPLDKIKTPAAGRKVNTGPIRLGLRARQNCWVKVRVDKKLVFQGTLRKGRSESWQAKERIEVSVGNARAIELEANGKIISPLGRGKEAIKNIVITREGVSVGK